MAHPARIAARDADARQRIETASGALAERFGIAPPAWPRDRDPALERAKRLEEIAGFVEGLAAKLDEPRPEPEIDPPDGEADDGAATRTPRKRAA